jgi:hypothetical protein
MKKVENKELLPVARVTGFLKGQAKKKFFEDLKRTGKSETKMVEEMVKTFYGLL